MTTVTESEQCQSLTCWSGLCPWKKTASCLDVVCPETGCHLIAGEVSQDCSHVTCLYDERRGFESETEMTTDVDMT